MMKFILTLIFLMLIFNKLEKMILQLFYQNLIFFLMFLMMILFPLNNSNIWLKLYNFIGSDFYSMGLIMLSFWIFSLMIMFSENNLIKLSYLKFIFILNFMLIFLLLSFMTMNLMMFYVFFESSLIPIFLLIMGWGMQIDRIQAGYYMMIYTLFGSLPLFIVIIIIYNIENSLMLNMIEINFINIYFYMMMMMAFLIKMPMYLFHLWLPKAHVEAPLIGSMILAGVMLKLGSYGLIRLIFIMINMCISYNKFIMVISLIGGIYSSLICLCQIDMKLLVAYSSIVHMSLLMAGILTMNNMGMLGGMLMMIAHGLCSSGLFCLVNINYERILSRSMFFNKGLINLFPSLSMIWFFMCSSNLSFPPSLNLFSEIMLFNSLINWNVYMMYLFMGLLFFSASYSLYLYSYSQHGHLNYFNYYMKMILVNEYLVLMLHWIPLNLLFIFMFLFI